MPEPVQTPSIEPRWPVALVILAVLVLLQLMPRPLKLWPDWVLVLFGVAPIATMTVVGLSKGETRVRWLRVERLVLAGLTILSIAADVLALAHILGVLFLRSSGVTGLDLLTGSVAVWVANILGFSLAYWLLDLGGPEARVARTRQYPDWLFPQEGAPDVAPPAWTPVYVDYLFLAFSTATAFSATDVLPLRARAKLLMMLEAGISLCTLLVVVSRAINILS
jgi:hypothetical protein